MMKLPTEEAERNNDQVDDERFELDDDRGIPRFGMILYDDLRHPAVRGLTPTAFRVWVLLATYINARTGAWAIGHTRMAEDLDIDERHLRRAIGELVTVGLLAVRKQLIAGGRSGWNRYALRRPPRVGEEGEIRPPTDGGRNPPGMEGGSCPKKEGRIRPPITEQENKPPHTPPARARHDTHPGPTDLIIAGRTIPGDLTALLFGIRSGRRDCVAAILGAGIESTEQLLRYPTTGHGSLQYAPGLGPIILDVIDHHLQEHWGIALGALHGTRPTPPRAPAGCRPERPPEHLLDEVQDRMPPGLDVRTMTPREQWEWAETYELTFCLPGGPA